MVSLTSLKLPYIKYLVISHQLSSSKTNMEKIIHVHLIFEKKDYYFGSISAIFDTLDANTVGIKKSTLLHSGLSDGSSIPTSRAIIKQSHIIRSAQRNSSLKTSNV